MARQTGRRSRHRGPCEGSRCWERRPRSSLQCWGALRLRAGPNAMERHVHTLLPGHENATPTPAIPPRGPVLRAFDLEIDTSTRSARRGGAAIALTAREYGLLEVLAAHRGRVVKYPLLQERLRTGTSVP